MSGNVQCPSCRATIGVEEPSEEAVRCPACGSIFLHTARSAGATSTPTTSTPIQRDRSWRMRTPEGQVYGPVPRAELDAWFTQGRLSQDCQLMDEQGNWQSAAMLYPQLAAVVGAAAAPVADPSLSANPPVSAERPHRGLLILVLAITGWVTCFPLFSIAAWVLGTHDLNEMRAGHMDHEGLGHTYAGQVLGMIHGVITIVLVLVAVFALLGRLALVS